MSFSDINFWQWGDSVKSLPEVQVKNTHFFFLVYQANNSIIEVYQVGQTSLHLPECMSTTPHHLFVLHVLEMVSRIKWSVTFPGIEVKLTEL